mgnify:CR=1 FL=1
MHNRIFLRATALSLALLAASAPAWATRTSTALGICISRGPDCSIANKGDNTNSAGRIYIGANKLFAHRVRKVGLHQRPGCPFMNDFLFD